MPEEDRRIHEKVRVLIGETGRERTHLLPVLQRVQAEFQHVPRAAAEAIEQEMLVPVADTYGVVTFFDLLTEHPEGRQVLRICDDVVCSMHGAEELIAEAEERIGPAGEPSADGEISWTHCKCLGLCERAPAALYREEPLAPLSTRQVAELGEGHA